MEAYRAALTVHDFFFYVSRELRVGVTPNVINNTAILYALNTLTPSVRRNISGVKPHYQEDRERFPIYATPAKLDESGTVVLGGEAQTFPNQAIPVKMSYNSVDSTLLVSMEASVFRPKEKKLAYPKVGSYTKYAPLTSFQFFTIGGVGPRVIRLGKKFSPAVALYERLENIEHRNGVFHPDHPVAISDLPENSEILEGTFIMLPNGLMVLNPTIKGNHYRGRVGGEIYTIAEPRPEQYPKVNFR